MRSEPIPIDPVRSVSGRKRRRPVLAATCLALLVSAPAAAVDNRAATGETVPTRLAPVEAAPAAPLATREVTLVDPALRVRVSGDVDAPGTDARTRVILDAAAETLRVCRAIGLGAPADDGNGELDIHVIAGDDRLFGRAIIDPASVSGRSAAGHVEIRDDPDRSIRTLRGTVVRSIARLVLAARDRTAPAWWTEPTVLWLEAAVAGETVSLRAVSSARFERPEAGVTSPQLAAANIALLHGLGDPDLEARLLADAWSRLAAREWTSDPLAEIDGAARAVTGLSLEGLLLRAAVAQVASGALPSRFGIDSPPHSAVTVRTETPVAPLGAALLRLRPDGSATAATELEVRPDGASWTLELLVERRDRGWERLRLASGADGSARLLVPWRDYRQAVVIASRAAEASAAAHLELSARSGGALEPYALSSFGGQRALDGQIEISWSTAWERDLFGWLVERADGPAGPWRSIQAVPVPALGLPDEGTGYALVDGAAPDRDTTWYRVVGITAAGLRVSGPEFAIGAPR